MIAFIIAVWQRSLDVHAGSMGVPGPPVADSAELAHSVSAATTSVDGDQPAVGSIHSIVHYLPLFWILILNSAFEGKNKIHNV